MNKLPEPNQCLGCQNQDCTLSELTDIAPLSNGMSKIKGKESILRSGVCVAGLVRGAITTISDDPDDLATSSVSDLGPPRVANMIDDTIELLGEDSERQKDDEFDDQLVDLIGED